jgi:hypothetical protein
MEGTIARSKRREQMKADGVPTWQRNGWSSVEQYRQYHRKYMRARRERVHEMS